MKKYIILLGLSMVLANVAGAHEHGGHGADVVIKKADKVIIKKGMSHREKIMHLKCLVMLKTHKTLDEAMQAKMEKINKRCEDHKLDAKKCEHIKHKVAKHIAGCFTVRDFFKGYLGE